MEKQLENQIKQTFMKAMQDLISKSVSDKLTDRDIEWLVSLCEELKDRINNLTPSRRDLHIQLNDSIDTDLIKQMLLNDAFDDNDVNHIVNCIFERLKMLCAPSQDKEISALQLKISNMKNFGEKISCLIMECNKIIDSIELLKQNFEKGKC